MEEGESLPNAKLTERKGETGKNLPQQEKIVLFFENPEGVGREYLFNRRPLPEPEDISLLKSAFLNDVGRGAIKDEDFQEMLGLIASPSAVISQGPENEEASEAAKNLFLKPEVDNKRVKGLLAFLVRENFEERGSVGAKDLITFAEKYPDPIALETNLSRFLEGVERGNGVEKRKEYEQALDLFQARFYGKRWEYYQQMKLLKEEARQKFGQEKLAESGQFIGVVENRLDSPLELVTRNGRIVAGTDEGTGYKSVNEDGIAINTKKEAFISIDGVGGHSGGREAKDILSQAFLAGIGEDQSFKEIQHQAHLAMRKKGQGGACYVAGKIIETDSGAVLEVAQAGDSRLVVLDEEGIKLTTKDENNPRKKSEVTNFVSYGYQGRTTTHRFRLEPGDRIIAASDGLWDNFSSEEVYRLTREKSPQEAMAVLNKRLRTVMISGGKPDNLNIIIYDFRPEEKGEKKAKNLISNLRRKINPSL